ncbi:hypothetical protein QBC45DRAFT_454117 [Copromyces sp. CBS 386.78]|uniref:WGS project CABT00000000 data, contig 2.28 n=3 Tax=Sordariaceae TaxID=5148 RepID=F7W4T2_SORMK|nr:uncharacterized protein SMAC_08375 [Sordaria macrospora k-hell]KAA8631392.1 hypothetical protein SMACR_08375 [Sordaria macrospora]KAK1775262.1 hypothetical protein QBC45DRAFT_454117 [Copromyces sp. CBS 386.78]KAK3955390.1 hypothetical protein QBC32DRAFT_367866 [Pseudoneurospora amorphoporcata]WPJ60169.1 hypothetical protein SMAC4_08375 [Sordaria macrospora]CCC12519.1 unnamed protein product [Sordaria macrospora k-hell]
MDASNSTPTTQQTSSMASIQRSPVAAKIAPPQPAPAKTGNSTDAFLKDFTLVAEAAKRAQMAVMMRDFEDIGLS